MWFSARDYISQLLCNQVQSPDQILTNSECSIYHLQAWAMEPWHVLHYPPFPQAHTQDMPLTQLQPSS